MVFREALITDIPQIQVVRNAVKENPLPDPSYVTDQDCETFMFQRGKGWVCEADNHIVGFAIADLQDKNIWALFIHPDYEKKGIGKQLHKMMMDWYFSQTQETIWLGTAPGTRAEQFYRMNGWTETGKRPNGEVRFEYEYADWLKNTAS